MYGIEYEDDILLLLRRNYSLLLMSFSYQHKY